MSDIQEEQKRLYKRAEENDIKLLQEENKQLNNIIDELEKYICKQILSTKTCEVFQAKAYNNQMVETYKRDKMLFKMILDKLNQLKGDNK